MSEQPNDDTFWRQLAEQTRDAPLDSTHSEQMRARAAAAFVRGPPSRWRRWAAPLMVVALCGGFLGWAIWQAW
ncbi:MAG: hypothetical protein KBG15_06090 [Kofleriaceae bacterium]|nr:hypothetical protein [Kofleriaceae bacterium]